MSKEEHSEGASRDENIEAQLTRPDIFPPTQKIYKVFFTSVGMYSATPLLINKKMCELIQEKLSNKKLVLFDGTACTGADSIGIVFNTPLISVIANELDPLNYKALVYNVKLYGYDNKIKCMNQDTIDLLYPEIILDPKPNIIYIDCPWGGKDYNIFLYLACSTFVKNVTKHEFKNIVYLFIMLDKQ